MNCFIIFNLSTFFIVCTKSPLYSSLNLSLKLFFADDLLKCAFPLIASSVFLSIDLPYLFCILKTTTSLLKLIISINHTGACSNQLQLDIQADGICVEQISQDSQLIQIAVLHDTVIFFRLPDGQFQSLYPLHGFSMP